jgi:hypothetical protein
MKEDRQAEKVTTRPGWDSCGRCFRVIREPEHWIIKTIRSGMLLGRRCVDCWSRFNG